MTWPATLAKRERLVVKVGSSLVTNDGRGSITRRSRAGPRRSPRCARRAAKSCSCRAARSRKACSGSAGTARRSAVHELQAAAAVGQMGLIEVYESRFREHGAHHVADSAHA